MSVYAVLALLRRGGLVCAVSRKGRSLDLGLPGGKVDPGESPEEAIVREARQEVGIEVTSMRPLYEAIEVTTGKLCRCYAIDSWDGEPRSECEPGGFVVWAKPDHLTRECCTFREFNRVMFIALGLRPSP